ncbi:MAG: hypothetical protein IJP84_10725 [Lachnospiraceae bacterium]|nr:hypothetical protein [Lachnospiraceae bacterium]
MRRSGGRRNDILIDLTSLLDVIFILLMVVLARQQISDMDLKDQTAKLKEQQVELQAEKAETMDEYRLYSAQNDLTEKMVIISVTATFDPENPKERSLKILKNGNEKPEVFALSGGNTKEAFDKFEEQLVSYVKEAGGLPVVLSLADDGSEILYRDASKIQEIFNSLSSLSKDVYIRPLSAEGE